MITVAFLHLTTQKEQDSFRPTNSTQILNEIVESSDEETARTPEDDKKYKQGIVFLGILILNLFNRNILDKIVIIYPKTDVSFAP